MRSAISGRSESGPREATGLRTKFDSDPNFPCFSFKVLFQCKRFSKSVSPSHVRDFRGGMAGRADKGIILTTGAFTAEARREASRDGVPPIELIDGEKLVDMLEQLELGLRAVKTYDVDQAFFKEFDG